MLILIPCVLLILTLHMFYYHHRARLTNIRALLVGCITCFATFCSLFADFQFNIGHELDEDYVPICEIADTRTLYVAWQKRVMVKEINIGMNVAVIVL